MRRLLISSVRSIAACFVTALFAAVIAASSAAAIDRFAQSKKTGLVLKGYDTTAYHTAATPRPGSEAHVVTWKGAKWHFASAKEAALFRDRPEAYAPRFGAYCTRAMSKGIVIAGKPKIWRMHNDKLYVFFAPIGGTKFDEGPEAMIAKAQANWDKLKLEE